MREIKDLRDDICHRSSYGRLRTARFPGFIDLIRAGGGKAPFASEADLRGYLCGLFQRWFAFAHFVGDFVTRRVKAEHPERQIAPPGGLIVAEGEIDVTAVSDRLLFPLGTTIMTLSRRSLDSIDYFIGKAA